MKKQKIDCGVLIMREKLMEEAEKCNDAELLDLVYLILKVDREENERGTKLA